MKRYYRHIALIALLLSLPAQVDAQPDPDCLPTVTVSLFGTVHIGCGDETRPCGIVHQPTCWTVRLACMHGGSTLVDVYDDVRDWANGAPRNNSALQSTCSQQPEDEGNRTRSAGPVGSGG